MLDRRLFLSSSALAMAATGMRLNAAPSADGELDHCFDTFFTRALDDSPELVSSLGLDTGGRASAKSRLDDASIGAWQARRQTHAAQLATLRAMNRSALSPRAMINFDAMLYDRDMRARVANRFEFGGDGPGQPYVLSQLDGAYGDIPGFLDTRHTIATREDCEAYLSRLSAFAVRLDQETARFRRDAGLGVVPPDFAMDATIGQMKALLVPAEQSDLVSSLARRAATKGIAGDWSGRAAKIYTGSIAPALQRQIAALEHERPRAVHEAGVWRLPDGEAFYAASLRARTTTDLSPDEIHRMGLEVSRDLTARADVLFRAMGMTQGSVAQRYAALYRDPQYLYPNTDAGKAKEIADLNVLVQAMEQRLPEYFSVLPKASLEIRRVPPAIEAGSGSHYTEGSLDGTRPGIFWLNLRDTGEAPRWTMPTTTFHEGVPGHHLQLSLQQQSNLPMLRKITSFGAYVEGWALYAEQLAQEMGFYADNAVGELGYIHDALLRSGRLVVDTGLHAMRWTREQAVAALSEIDGDPVTLSGQEIERYACAPGQACSYMIGKLTILRLRAKAMAGNRRSIKAFHEVVLSGGALPLAVLEGLVDKDLSSTRP
ncbi:MAG: DUF885 family protein [Arachidicoccus sp.]|nr:DUF885 family protein [Arachidicoccus sp.]